MGNQHFKPRPPTHLQVTKHFIFKDLYFCYLEDINHERHEEHERKTNKTAGLFPSFAWEYMEEQLCCEKFW